MEEEPKSHTRSQEESDQWKNHLLTKLLVEKEHPKHDLDRDQTKNGHGVLDDLENFPKLPDVSSESINQVTWETIGPETVLAFTEGNLELHCLFLMAIFLEKVQGVFECWRTTLNAIVHP